MTLSQTAVLTKQIITVSAFALILAVASFIGYKIWYAYYLAHLPPVEEKPDIKFGSLPAINFGKTTVSSSNFAYAIDTTTGNLPMVGQEDGFEKFVKVYFVTKTVATLLSSEKSKSLAEKFAILSDPEILSETNYRFGDDDKTLTVDLDSGNFMFKKISTISDKESLDDDSKLVADFEGVLDSLGVLKEDLKNGRTHVLLLKKDGEELTKTELRTETVAAQISLWPAKIDKKVIFTPLYDTSLIYARVVKGADNLQNYLLLNYTYYPVDTSTFATYPLKSSEEAFEDLRSGKGQVIIEPHKPQVSITSMYLAYFLQEIYSPYLQPIFVFEGPNFVAYTPAISEQYLTPAK